MKKMKKIKFCTGSGEVIPSQTLRGSWVELLCAAYTPAWLLLWWKWCRGVHVEGLAGRVGLVLGGSLGVLVDVERVARVERKLLVVSSAPGAE